MEIEGKQPHILLGPDQVTPVVIVVGDPARTLLVASVCDSFEELASNREYKSILCRKDGQKFVVISHGVGSPGAAICFEELIKCGAKVIIRAGTAGGLQKDLEVGSIVLYEAVFRDDGLSDRLIPTGFPAAASFDVVQSLKTSAESLNTKYHMGIGISTDIFYNSEASTKLLQLCSESNVLAVDMEVGALFVVARLRGIQAGAVCVIDGSPLSWAEGNQKDYDPYGTKIKKCKEDALRIVVATCVDLSKRYY